MPRRLLAAVLLVALSCSACGIKGPLVPPPKATAEAPPPAKDAAPAERKP